MTLIESERMDTTDCREDEELEADQFTDPNDPRTMECDRWAYREAARMQAAQPGRPVQVIRIEPEAGRRRGGANFIGPIWLPSDRYHHPNPAWTFHCAVLSDGIARDELYPNGLPFEAYKRIFEYWDDLAFDPDPNWQQQE